MCKRGSGVVVVVVTVVIDMVIKCQGEKTGVSANKVAQADRATDRRKET